MKIKSSFYYKLFSANSLLVFAKLLSGFLISKATAIFIGPIGMGVLGNFRTFLAVIENVCLLGLNQSLVKYVSENKQDHNKLKKTIYTAFVFVVMVLVFVELVLFSVSNYVSSYLGVNQLFFIIFLLLFPFYIASSLLLAIVNGLEYYKKLITVQVLSQILSVCISLYFIASFSFGALVSVLAFQLVVFVYLLYYFIKKKFGFIEFKTINFDRAILKNFLIYALMFAVSGVLGSWVLFAIRAEIVKVFGLHQAGIYEALQRIASYSLLLVSSFMSMYYFPKLSQTSTLLQAKPIVLDYLKKIWALFIVLLIVVFLFRDFIIQILFTNKFVAMSELFLYQLLGDAFKAFSLILGTVLIAQKRVKAFLFTELLSLSVLWCSTKFLLASNQTLESITQAYCFTYVVYSLVLLGYFIQIFTTKSIIPSQE
jgi:polysaccharide transporter, PST family